MDFRGLGLFAADETGHGDRGRGEARDVLVAVYEDLHLFVVVTGSTAEYPGSSPKHDVALLAWFQQHFTT
ncbi:hypothetical protein [Nocardia sp. NPDC051981]|uniref:hypothetical protein n=1 Tax=Nocardia sp. NPDC051981 TaxID=3155417 RepID=UPI00342595BD